MLDIWILSYHLSFICPYLFLQTTSGLITPLWAITKGTLVSAVTPTSSMPLRPGATPFSQQLWPGSLGCTSGFDYVWTSSSTIDNAIVWKCFFLAVHQAKQKINKPFLWFVLVAAGILGVLKQGAQDAIGKRTDQLSETHWPFRPSPKPRRLQTSCGIRISFWRHCWEALIR